jgi:hypothetical protein
MTTDTRASASTILTPRRTPVGRGGAARAVAGGDPRLDAARVPRTHRGDGELRWARRGARRDGEPHRAGDADRVPRYRLLFPETYSLRDEFVRRYDLNLREYRPLTDPGPLYETDTDGCCAIRKVEPMQRALGDFDAWVSGVRR